MKKYISLFLTVSVVGLFVWYALSNPDLFTSLTNVSIAALVAIVLLRVVTIWSNGMFTVWTVEAFIGGMSRREGFMIAVLTAIGNFFGPLLGGMGVRAIYLKKYHKLPFSKFTATLIGYYIMMFTLNALMAFVALLLLPKTPQTNTLLLIFGGWAALFVGLAFMRLPSKQKTERLRQNKLLAVVFKVLYDIEDGWKVLKRNRILMLQMGGLAIVNLIALYFVSWVEFWALGIATNVAALALYTALVQVSLLLSITPGAVGLREALLLIVATTLGLSASQIVQVAVLDRAVYFVMLAVLAVVTRHSKLRTTFAQTKQA